MQQVPPAPLNAQAHQTAFLGRSLTDDSTREFLAQRSINASTWPPERWTPEQLVLAALLQHPAAAQARARAALARAQLTTAGLTPRTLLAPESERTNERDAGQSAWSVGLALDLALTGESVREARVERARLLADAALLDEADAAWAVRSGAQRALIELWSANAELALLDRLVVTTLEAQAVMQKRYDLGAADALELTQTRTAAAQAESRYVLAEQRQIRARGDLAQALALPLSTLDALRIDYTAFDEPVAVPAMEALRANATLDRIDLRRALAQHAAAEAALTIELRAQYPEIRIKPGLLWDQGATVWSLGAALPLFAAQRQAGPIAEAVARRDMATQDFLALQSQALVALEHSRTRVKAAELDIDGAEAEHDEARLQLTRTEQRYARGDADRLDRLLARVRVLEADIRLLYARQRTLASRLALEDAVQRPLTALTGPTETAP
ncbi:TolC family protein [Methyloversatilis sp. XJ19-49]|uniref:TolC family protein n=1 Tax=Methyloversatilis sp. XJ19-49 TaxID=2963429 RepID=UPI00211B84F2|nr:TolC family protein [Methyloversatilis sp. XJ19-49]MCQ9376683.1 TolC family protein [Methyloversatilis sp. XJ19-49]